MIHCPAPRREAYSTDAGWATRPWTEQGVKDVQQYGGFFLKGHHDFESNQVARLAGVRGEE